MRNDTFMLKLGSVFVLLFAAFCLWQAPGILTGKLTEAEIEQHLVQADKNLHLGSRTVQRVRAWALQDDGKPFYMVNLMRYRDKNQPVEGASVYPGTPHETNAHYENIAAPLLIGRGGSLPFGGDTQAPSVFPIGADDAYANTLGRVLVVRYTSRRAFLQLLSDPAYAPVEPFKAMSMEFLLAPTHGETVAPDLRLALGAILLLIFTTLGWMRARRTNP